MQAVSGEESEALSLLVGGVDLQVRSALSSDRLVGSVTEQFAWQIF